MINRPGAVTLIDTGTCLYVGTIVVSLLIKFISFTYLYIYFVSLMVHFAIGALEQDIVCLLKQTVLQLIEPVL